VRVADLEQAEFFEIAVPAVGLGIHGDPRGVFQALGQVGQ